jgi:hypothetical protein
MGAAMSRNRLPNRRSAEIRMFDYDGRIYRVTFGSFTDGHLDKIFLDVAKVDSSLQRHADDAGVLVSLLLQNNVPSGVIRRSISGPIRTALDLWLGRSAP